MRCPFLREAQVKFCRASAYRKMIVRLPGQPENERCSSPAYVNCPAVKQHSEDHPSIDHCPFLHESLVQYCAAAAVTKYIPYSESLLSRCGTDNHRYCDLYLALAQPREPSETEMHETHSAGTNQMFDDIRVPAELYYSPNHMWMDLGSGGMVHIGIDAFLAKVIGLADHVTFVTTNGFHRPTVSFSVHGIDLQFVFPLQVNILRANTYLRTNPGKIFTDPYTLGWLFEAVWEKPKNNGHELNGLLSGNDSSSWMKHEIERMNSLAHHISSLPDMRGAVLMADGGSFQTGIALLLTKEELFKLYSEFFSPLAVWNTQP
jgi:glycine cleavage system H lipoate-binding protein